MGVDNGPLHSGLPARGTGVRWTRGWNRYVSKMEAEFFEGWPAKVNMKDGTPTCAAL